MIHYSQPFRCKNTLSRGIFSLLPQKSMNGVFMIRFWAKTWSSFYWKKKLAGAINIWRWHSYSISICITNTLFVVFCGSLNKNLKKVILWHELFNHCNWAQSFYGSKTLTKVQLWIFSKIITTMVSFAIINGAVQILFHNNSPPLSFFLQFEW